MHRLWLLALVGVAAARFGTHESCRKVDWIDIGIYFAYSNVPIFQNLLPDTEENRQLDNVCLTYFPAVDNPDMYLGYESRVYCDGSNVIITFMVMQISFGIQRIATPFNTVTDHTFAYDGIETYFHYRCSNWGDEFDPFVYGTTFTYQRVPLSFLRDIRAVVEGQGLPEQDFYIVPMRLPHKCVTEPLCVPPPNPLFNTLPGEPGTYPVEPSLLNDIPLVPVLPPELPALIPSPAESLGNGISNIPFPVPNLLFEESPFISLPTPIVLDIPDIPIPLPGPTIFDTNRIPLPLPDPLQIDIPAAYYSPVSGSLLNDLINPSFFKTNPGLINPPSNPFFNSLAGRPQPPPFPLLS